MIRPDHSEMVLASFELGSQRAIEPGTGVAGGRSPTWVHLDRLAPGTAGWLGERAGLDPMLVRALLSETTRPRVSITELGVLLILRGVNLNEGAVPEDMISIRIWIEPTRVISMQGQRLRSIEDLVEQFRGGQGPKTVGDLLVAIITGLTDRMTTVMDELEDRLDDYEDRIADPDDTVDRRVLVETRRRLIGLRRFLGPQAAALERVHDFDEAILTRAHRRALNEPIHRVIRFVEDLDAAKARAQLLQEELDSQAATVANRRMYVLTLIAGIFLPLTLISGMLGMNVGGVPLSDSAWGFGVVTGVMGTLGFVAFLVIRRRQWL